MITRCPNCEERVIDTNAHHNGIGYLEAKRIERETGKAPALYTCKRSVCLCLPGRPWCAKHSKAAA